ncbi:hypothetical protein BDM02DRAFT_3107657 [Thelephora ganbajun]|uniref:Uncharacterized protein n=1 Tax=Thelephora ganbajun TaxID=370292 RepID=A0ACB6ZVS0_THEGA|nr:hypothetical protein BDM02DRAFT_3107657 [Thelephora ganbajun]
MSPIPSAPGTPQSPEIRKGNDERKSSNFEAQQSQAAANLLATSLSAPGKASSPVPLSPRRNSDPTGRVSRDLETLAGRVESLEVSRSTPEVKEPETQPLEDAPSQRSTPAPLEKNLTPILPSLSAVEGERQPSAPDPQDKDGDNVSVSSASGLSPRDNQVRRSGLKPRLRPLDFPVVNTDNESTRNSGITKQSDGSSGIHREQEGAGPSSQKDATPKTVPVVSADTTTSVTTPARFSVASSRSSNSSEESSPRVNVLPSPDHPSSHPSPNPSFHATSNTSATSSPVPFSQRSPSSLNLTPTPSPSQVQSTSPALPSSTLVSPAQYDRSNSLDLPSFASFLRQSYTDVVSIHPPPPYQTAILSQAVSVNGGEPLAGSSSSLPSYIHTRPNRQGGGPRLAQPVQLPQAQAQRSVANVASVSEGVVRERSESVSDTRMPRNRPLGPRNPSGSQGLNKVSSLGSDRSRQGSISSIHPNSLRSGVGLGTPPTSRKLSTTSTRGRSGPRFPTVPAKWRGHTLDVARWTFTSQQLQEIASRAIKASAESYYVRLLKLETLDTELPEELHRLEMLTTDLKTRIRATAVARRELLDALTAHTSGTGTFNHHNLEGLVEELGTFTQLADELNDELYTAADQIAQLKRLMDVHSSSALAMALRKLNTSFLKQAAENQFLRERVATLEAERDIAWTQAEHVAQEFDDLSTKLEQGISCPSSADNSRRASRVGAARKSSVRASKAGLRQSIIGKTNPRMPKRSSSASSSMQPSEDIPPVPPIPGMQDLGSGTSQSRRHRPPLIQTVNLPDQVIPAGLYSEMTPTTETRAMAQAQRELCEMLGISPADLNAFKPRPQSMSGFSRSNGLPVPGLVRHNSDTNPLTPKRCSQQYQDYILSPYDVGRHLSPRSSRVYLHFVAAGTHPG